MGGNSKNRVYKFLIEWVKPVFELIALIVVLFDLLPKQLLEAGRENGIAAIIFLSNISLLLIFINWRQSVNAKQELEAWETRLNEKITSLESAHAAALKECNAKIASHLRLAKYAETFAPLNHAFNLFHGSKDVPQKQTFVDFCNKLALTYKKLTGVECSVCIKISVLPEKHKGPKNNASLNARTFVRDSLQLGRGEIDQKKLVHPYIKNTDFAHIFTNLENEVGRCFFCNNLASVTKYKNTSFLAYEGMESEQPFHHSMTTEEKEKAWPLKYKSTIIAPICPVISTPRKEQQILGFLCLDTIEKDVFLHPVDSEVVIGCANALHKPLEQFLVNFVSNN